jgi:hypothetical protein
MGIFYFPCEFLYWTKYEKHDEMKEIFTKWIDDHEDSYKKNTNGLTNAHTSYGCVAGLEFLTRKEILPELVLKPFSDMLNTYHSRPNTENLCINAYHVSTAWYTKYETNGRFGMHKHDYGNINVIDDKFFKTTFSIIYILNDKHVSNSTSFFIPNSNVPSTSNRLDYKYDTSSNPEIGEGSILIFPASLYHEVYPSIEPGRITISYNIDCSFERPETHASP